MRRLITRIGAALRHRINNPLQAILSEAELLAASEAGQAQDVAAAAAVIEQGARRIAAVLTEFEALAEAESAAEDSPSRTFDDSDLTRALAAELAAVARQAEVRDPVGTADPLRPRLRRAARLANLWLSNTSRLRPSYAPAPGARAHPTDPRQLLSGAGGSAAAVALANRLARLEAEHRELIERLEKRERFWRFATHELRNAANAFVSWAYVLRKSEIRSAPWFAPLLRAAEAVLRRAEEALELDAVGRDDFPVRLETVNLVDAAKDAMQLIRPTADHHNLTLAVAAPPAGQPVWATADPDRLQQVLHNLLRNAAEVTPPGGSISITTQVLDDEAILEVEDTGPGIPMEVAESPLPFDPSAPAPERRSGFGLGLPLSRYLVEQMGGTFVLEPSQPGAGARLVLRFPRAEP